MKKIIVLFALLLGSIISIAQPVTQRGTTSVTVQDARLFAQYNFRPPVFPDTTSANTQIGLDSCGALIFSRDINAYYYRACSPKRWVRVASGGATADSAYLSYRPLTDSTFLLCRVGGTRCDTIKINGKGVSTAWLIGGNVNPIPPYIGTIDTKEIDVITNNVVRMRVAGNGINRSSASRNKYLMIDTSARYLYYGDADTAYTSSHKINDTTFSLCRTNGKCDTITIGNTVINNIVNYQTRLISGSAVWDSLMIYSVTQCNYYINGILYTSAATNVTLAVADSSNPRIDVIYCDTSGNVGVITGIPSPNPVKPVVNPLSQIELTHVNINAQGTTPANVSGRIIYNENVGIPNEWNTSTDFPLGVNFNYSINPYNKIKSAFAPNNIDPYSLNFTNNAFINADTVSTLSMYVRLNSPAPINRSEIVIIGGGVVTESPLFSVYLMKSGEKVTSLINVINGNYGYDRSIELSYQHIAIPLSDFTFLNSADKTFDQMVIYINGLNIPKLGVQFDYIIAVSGGNPPPITGNFWSLSGNDNSSFPNAKLGTTSKSQLSIVTNDEERINITDDGAISIPQLQTTTDTLIYKPVVINPTTGEVASITNWGNNIVYTQNPIMSKVSNDSNIIYFNADTANAWRGGGGTIPNLQQVTDIGASTTNPIYIDNSFYGHEVINRPSSTYGDYNDLLTYTATTDSLGLISGFRIRDSFPLYNNVPSIYSYGSPTGQNSYYQLGITNDALPYLNIHGGANTIDLSSTSLKFQSNANGAELLIPNNGTSSYIPLSVNGNYANSSGNITISGGGTGTVTSISQGYGITNSPNPITTTGTITVDTSASGLSGKYLRKTDTTSMLANYPTGSGSATTLAFWNGTRSLTNNTQIVVDNTTPTNPSIQVRASTGNARSAMTPTYSGTQYDANNYAYNSLVTAVPFFIAHEANINRESRLYSNQLKFSDLTTSGYVNLNPPTAFNNRTYNLPDSSGTIALKDYTVNSISRTLGKDSIIFYVGSTRYAIKDSVGTNPPASGYYLSISDSTTQDNPTANTPRAVKFNVTDLANGFSLNTQTAIFVGTINNGGVGAGTTLNVTSLTSGKIKVGMVLTGGSITAGTFISAFISGSGGIGTYEVSVSQLRTSATYTGTMTSQIVCANTGIYNLQFSSQMDKTDAGVDYVNFWLRKNGTDITASSGVISLQGNSPAYMMAAWNYVIQLVAGDTIELYWGSADINMSIKAEASQTSPFAHPAVQSTIFTITQQSGILAGTGITGLGTSGNAQTGAVQTLATGTSGSDFNISSSSNTQTFNLPNASSSNRGALLAADWTTFNNKIGAADTSVFQRKSISSYTMLANNTNATANATAQTFVDKGEQAYTGTIVFTGTAPTTIINNTYQWSQIGKTVTLFVDLLYTNGNSTTNITFDLPSDCPTPSVPSGYSGASSILYYGTYIVGNALTLGTVRQGQSILRKNAANTGYEITTAAWASLVTRNLQFQITYRAQ